MTYKGPGPEDLTDCDVVDLTSGFEQFQGPAVAFIGTINAMTAATLAVYPIFRELTDNCLHLHAKHYHSVSYDTKHEVSDKSDGGSNYITSSTQGNIDTLGIEQNSFTDVNQTGMIFGKDYAFENSLNLPRFYKAMFSSDVNDYSESMMTKLQDFDKYVTDAMSDLFMAAGDTCATNYAGASVPQSLILEFFKGEDLDNNGLIYGEDFVIDDPNAPLEITDLNDSNNLVNADGTANLPGTDSDGTGGTDSGGDGTGETDTNQVITWDDYLKTIDDTEEIIMECQISPFTKQELINELINEFDSRTDQNGDGLIYGKDFLIIGDSKPIELNPYVPLYLPGIIVTWISYVKSREYNQPYNISKYETLLIDEFIQNKDLDGNGIVYGRDFIIIDQCIDNSPLMAIDTDPNCQVFSLSQYDDTIKPYIENYVLDENIQAAKYNAEYLDKVDVDGNGLIYGVDFILTDYEDNKTECLWTIERYRNLSLSWTPAKLTALKLTEMISDYTQEEFDLYWMVSSPDDDVDEPVIEPVASISYDCESSSKPIIPLDFDAYDLSNHIILYNGTYWFDLGTDAESVWDGVYSIPDGTEINLTSLTVASTFEYFTDAIVYHIKSKAATSDAPYVFNIIVDGRTRVFPSERFFSITDQCLDFNDTVIQQIESSTESGNFIIVADTRTDKTIPFDKNDVTGYMVRWIYDDTLATGKWVLGSYYDRILNRVILLNYTEPRCNVCVPKFKSSEEFTHFLPFILNVVWNDIQ